MSTKKENVKRREFTEEELKQLKKYLEVQNVRKEIMGLLDGYFCSSCSLFEQKELFSDFITEWHDDLKRSVENTERMIENGRP